MRYPFSYLPKTIVSSLVEELKIVSNDYKPPLVIELFPTTSYTYYMRGSNYKRGVVIKINDKVRQCSWGTWHGDYHDQEGNKAIGVVNTDKTIHVLDKNTAIIKCYVDYNNHYVTGEILLHEHNMPAQIPLVDLSLRERQILFILNIKNKSEMEMALCRLAISQQEIADLYSKQILKSSSKGRHLITIIGEAARLEIPRNDLW
jgi:hypothetical protein